MVRFLSYPRWLFVAVALLALGLGLGLTLGLGGDSDEGLVESPPAAEEQAPSDGAEGDAAGDDAAPDESVASAGDKASGDDAASGIVAYPAAGSDAAGDSADKPAEASDGGEAAEKDEGPMVVAGAISFVTDSFDPVLGVRVPNTSPVVDGLPNLHATELKVTPLMGALSVTGHPISSMRDPLQDLELALTRLAASANQAGNGTLDDMSSAQEVMDILLGNTEGRMYDGYPMLAYNRGAFASDHMPGEFKMKRLTDTGETVMSPIDGQEHKIWEVTINMLWFRQNFESDMFLMRVPFEADDFDHLRINWRVYSLIQEDLAPTTIMNDGFGRIFHGFDSTFTSIPAFALGEISINYPSLKHFRGLYNWGWGNHPPRVSFLQPVYEINADGGLHPHSLSFVTRNRENLTIENISDAAPEKKAMKVAEAALNGASGAEVLAMLTDPDTGPRGTFREWVRLADDQRQLPPEAWDVLLEEDGLLPGEFGDYDIVVAFMNNKLFGDTPYAQPGSEGKGGVVRDWEQAGVVRVKVINLDNHTYYYRNVDFGAQFSEDIEDAFGNGKFSFEKFNPKPTYGVPKVAEMQWRTGWGFVPHKGIRGQSGLFPREVDLEYAAGFLDQLGEEHLGYVFQNVSGYWRFNPPAGIREGEGLPAGDPLREMDGTDGVMIGLDTEGFGVAKMPEGMLTKHPNQASFAEQTFPGFLRNPNSTGGDIIPPTPPWAPYLTLNPETGTLLDLDGTWWVDQTYFHGRPVLPQESFAADVEAPRAGAQLFYQFDPLFHDNSVFSLHPRSDIVR